MQQKTNKERKSAENRSTSEWELQMLTTSVQWRQLVFIWHPGSEAERNMKQNHSCQKYACFQLYFLRFVCLLQTRSPLQNGPSQGHFYYSHRGNLFCRQQNNSKTHTHKHTLARIGTWRIQENPLTLRLNYLGNENGTRENWAFHCVCFTPDCGDTPTGWKHLVVRVKEGGSVYDGDQGLPFCFWVNWIFLVHFGVPPQRSWKPDRLGKREDQESLWESQWWRLQCSSTLIVDWTRCYVQATHFSQCSIK